MKVDTNKTADLPNKVIVKITRCESGTYIADMPEFNMHVEAKDGLELLKYINNAIKLYFDVPENSPILYAPQDMFTQTNTQKFTPMDFLKYCPSSQHNNLC